MGCFDGAEVCELVGCFILKQIKSIMNINDVGLYRDDGLGVMRNLSGPETDRKRKDLINIFKDCGLSITCETNLKIVNFLDIQLNLENNTIRPYMKPSNNPVYINKHSNHPPNILQKLPKSISRRISDISSNENIFKDSITIYENALKSSGFNENLTYTTTSVNKKENEEKKKRKRNIIWYNPPYSANVKTNLGKTFFKLISKHFPRENKLYKIFNKNTLKISYSCMKNISAIIASHNRKILNPPNENFGCNCRNKESCPLDNKCLTPKIIYKALVSCPQLNETKTYIGLSETPFKDRYGNHKKAIRHKKYSKETELSKYIWELKDKQIDYTITWSILQQINGKISSINCQLCLAEKYHIMNSLGDENLLNKRNEFVTKCMHQNKYLLSSIKTGVG